MSINCFISHNKADKAFARKLSKDLNSQGFNTWFDENIILAGDSISDSIQKGIQGSDVFIIILSEDSVNSRWVKEELRAAIQKRISEYSSFTIIPILLKDCEIPLFLKDYLFISFKEQRKYNQSFSQLCYSIIYKDEFLEKYKSSYVGRFITDQLIIDIELHGETCNKILFTESYTITPVKKYKESAKEIVCDGLIQNVSLSSGKIIRNKTGKTSETWKLLHDDYLLPKTQYKFNIKYEFIDDYTINNRWFFEIDSPTRLLTIKFHFTNTNKPNIFTVEEMQTKTSISIKEIQPKLLNQTFLYKFSIKYPPFQNKFIFEWK